MPSTLWDTQRERGSQSLLRAMLWIMLHLGWRAGRLLLFPIALYFFASSGAARRASRDFLRRATGHAGPMEVLRHIFTFAAVIFERVFLLTDRMDGFEIELQGLDLLKSVLAQGRGCVLLGAHFGSFEVLRIIGRHAPVRVRPLMYRRNTGAVTQILEGLDPVMRDAIIEIGRPESMLAVRDALAAGEMVGMLADRAAGGGKLIAVDFLGSPAQFPTGPFIAVASLDAPVLLFYGIRTGTRRYEVRFEPFADRIRLPRATRAEALRNCVERFAAGLAVECRRHPFNWFNFFPFWENTPYAPASSRQIGAGGVDGAVPGAGPGAVAAGSGAGTGHHP
ncbi:MAG TPA: acyltransferase [Acetobacteraceae bacterium]|jgi:predicted LPLAT superfamily acyltransferase